MNQKTKRTFAIRSTAIVLLLALSGAGLAACREEKGPMENAGEKIDETVNDAKRAVEDAGD
jgi:hypothetical protein